MQKRWSLRTLPPASAINQLSAELNINPVLSTLLLQRGINNFDEARAFFRPDLGQMHNPFLMRDMDIAIARIEQALTAGERIMVYGDYDVDGTTSVALVYSFFKRIYNQLEYYIPDRYAEGYGISTRGIDYAQEQGISLIIALDCGIKSVDKIAYANELGIDFIICDHHTPGDELPRAVAVLDPKRADCPYPFKELPGCGIGFKLVQAFAQKNNIPFDSLTEYFQLVAISIACDIVHINGETRLACNR